MEKRPAGWGFRVRYFYDCPIKAAYMNKYFGVETYATTYAMQSNIGLKYYIHDGSLQILEPQVGDVVEGNGYVDKLLYGDVKKVFHSIQSPAFNKESIDRIIDRNGVPFIWPESEP
jgi:hypothetical protein